MKESKSNISNKLSVIVPVYNTEKYICNCLKSIINQTYRNLEIIIIDDGSTDSSISICKEIEKEDRRVVLISNKNKGVSSARNYGIKKAKGKYITFVDSDDYLELNAFEKAMNNIKDCDAIFYGYCEEFEGKNSTRIVSPKKTGIVNPNEAIYVCMFPNENCYFTSVCNKIFAREKVKSLYFDDLFAVGEDEVWLVQALLKLSKVFLYNQPLYNYIQRPDSTTHSAEKIIQNWQSHLMAKEKIIHLIFENNKLYDSIVAKEYNDLFNLYVKLYLIGAYNESQELYNKIKIYRKQFFNAKEFSYKRKIKNILIDIIIRLKVPKKCLVRIWGLTTNKIKEKIKKQHS